MIDPKTGEIVRTTMKDIRLDEISAVDRPAQPGATMSIMKRAPAVKADDEDDSMEPEDEGEKGPKATKKRAFLTTPTDGHSHLLSDEVGPDMRGASGSTSWEDGHAHPWIMNTDTGAITIGMVEGHTHDINLNGGDGKPPGVIDLSPGTGLGKAAEGTPDPSSASKFTSGVSADPVGTVPNEVSMTTKNEKTVDQDAAVAKQLADLTKANERLTKISELSDAQRGIFKSLEGEGADAFLALDSAGRDAEVTKAADANAVVFEDEGVEYRKSDDPRMVILAKRAKLERELRVASEKRATEGDLRKRAEELKHLPGDVEVRMSMLKGIDTLPEDQVAPALAALKAQDLALGEAFKRAGTSVVPSEVNPLDAIAKGIADKDSSLTPEMAMAKALETPEGEAAYAKSLGY